MRARVIVLFVAGLVLLPAFAAAQSSSSQQASGAGPIQTQIANLQATLTAIAVPSGTPSAAPKPEFDYIESFGNTKMHIAITGLVNIQGDVYDTIMNETFHPHGKYVALYFKVTNLGTEPVSTWNKYSIKIRDQKGRAFSSDGDATSAQQFSLDLYTPELQPDLAYDAVLVFDVAPDARDYSIEVDKTSVNLPLGQAS